MTAPDWLTLTVTAIPLFGIAGSSIAYVIKLYQEAAERRRARFFKLLELIDGTGPIAGKVGAVYALQDFKEHKDFIERFCETQKTNVTGPAAPLLIGELEKTRSKMRYS